MCWRSSPSSTGSIHSSSIVGGRGMAAKGVFEVTHDVSDLIYADFLSQVGHPTGLRR